jgi:hypothetical protein
VLIFCLGFCIYKSRQNKRYGNRVVICVPVYGQSYALGEEAIRITNFDSLNLNHDGRIVTENLDHRYGYFDYSDLRIITRRILGIHNKSFELSVYSMAELLASNLGKDTLICIFPGGQGLTDITNLSKGTIPYFRFLKNIAKAYSEAKKRNWELYIPAICWMQGESDIADYPNTNYKELLCKFSRDINRDVKSITHQNNDVKIVCYQTSTLTKGNRYKENNYYGTEVLPSEAQMELIRDDSLFWASGPTYPYSFVNEALHIDANSQRKHGLITAKSVLGIIRNDSKFKGVIPINKSIEANKIILTFNVPTSPLVFDTIHVRKANNMGFNVIKKDGKDIISDIQLLNDTIIITCTESPINCKVRYGVNGEYMKSGWRIGPRGNLRDSSKEQNWCYFFEL